MEQGLGGGGGGRGHICKENGISILLMLLCFSYRYALELVRVK